MGFGWGKDLYKDYIKGTSFILANYMESYLYTESYLIKKTFTKSPI